ncbi:MAG TPA: hypothetical protein VLP43_05965 [Solirubrobacteraceae bacterium]|nr:hypothetical protein [Solirubrobacteraceae bacterium]
MSWGLGALVAAGFIYYVLPRIVGLGPTLRRLRSGDVWWLALGVVLEAISLLGEIALVRGVFARPGNRIDWKVSYRLTMAGTAATKLLAAAGVGGIALTVWALRGYGLSGPRWAPEWFASRSSSMRCTWLRWRSPASGCGSGCSADGPRSD